jgi:methylthioribose-1-phosphate isomerase
MEVKLNFKTLEWSDNRLRLLDQTKLPENLVYVDFEDYKAVALAIKTLQVRGAPAIGIAAAYGVVLGMLNGNYKTQTEYKIHLEVVISELKRTRPTAVNLFWALERMRKLVDNTNEKNFENLNQLLLEEALSIHEEDRLMCEKIGQNGAIFLKDNDTVLTHCNAGALATGGIGTALGIIYTAAKKGKKVRVFVDETRPVLQGARLTAWELKQQGIDFTLICDNAAAWAMRKKSINAVIVGADRIARNLDTANKIGTYSLALLAKAHNIPFYVAAPSSTFDTSIENGDKIKIEERSADEVTNWMGKKTAPDGTKVFSPAFDVTPAELITSVITEKGIQKGKRLDQEHS